MLFKINKTAATNEMKYKAALNYSTTYLEKIKSTPEKVSYLKLIRTSIIDEIASEYNNMILYSGRFDSNEHKASFIFDYYNSSGEPYYKAIEKDYLCNLSKNKVISYPWNIDRFLNAHHIISCHEFEYDPINHVIVYYPQLDLYIATNGLHSIGAGVANKKGVIPCDKTFDLTKMFENISSENGMFWIDKTDPSSRFKIPDFRFALVFEISKLIWNYEK